MTDDFIAFPIASEGKPQRYAKPGLELTTFLVTFNGINVCFPLQKKAVNKYLNK